jgi:DMSO/TMAO reductase YedYZ molybdopterin-dependent catalytic subunit
MHQKIKLETFILLVFVSLAIGLTACATHPNVDWKFKISRTVSNPMVLTYADLARMPQTELKDVLMQKTTSEDTVNTWMGVPLDEIATKVGADPQYVTILAKGDDGYEILISKNELKGAIIALKMDGNWISEKDKAHGPIRLVCPDTPANKWIYALVEIQFNNQ